MGLERVKVIHKYRQDDPAIWTARNPVLQRGEPGYEVGTGRLKIGDGFTPWNLLEYFGGEGTAGGVTPLEFSNHISDETPHPAYDDGPSLTLLYENAKV